MPNNCFRIDPLQYSEPGAGVNGLWLRRLVSSEEETSGRAVSLQGRPLSILRSRPPKRQSLARVLQLFRSASGRGGRLTALGAIERRHLPDVEVATGLLDHVSPHSFPMATATDLLPRNVPTEDVAYLAATPTRGRPGCTTIVRGRVNGNVVGRIST